MLKFSNSIRKLSFKHNMINKINPKIVSPMVSLRNDFHTSNYTLSNKSSSSSSSNLDESENDKYEALRRYFGTQNKKEDLIPTSVALEKENENKENENKEKENKGEENKGEENKEIKMINSILEFF